MTQLPFWKSKALDELNKKEWESLCDGCGKCCLHKLEDADTGDIFYTDVFCRYLDEDKCTCTDYANRSKNVPACTYITPENISEHTWLPSTCAYRVLAEGKDLYSWHPLVSGDKESVHEEGMSIRDRAVDERKVDFDFIEERVIQWVV